MKLKTLIQAPVAALAALTLLLSSITDASDNPMDYIPEQVEVIVALDASALFASPIVEHFLEERFSEDMLETKLSALENLIGVNLLEDIHSVHFGGRIDDDESIVILLKGDFNADRLIALVQFNETYESETLEDGAVGHYWRDGDDENFVVALDEGYLVYAKSREVVDRCLAAGRDGEGAFMNSEYADIFNGKDEGATIWLAVPKLSPIDSELGEIAEVFQAEALMVNVQMGSDDVDVKASLIASTKEAAEQWVGVLEGMIALGELQTHDNNIAGLAVEAEVNVDEKINAATIQLNVPNDRFVEILEHAHELKNRH